MFLLYTQPRSLFNNKIVYLKISELGVTDFIYLYYNDVTERWVIARDVRGTVTRGRTTENSTGDPVKLKARWSFNTISSDMNNVTLDITCDGGSPFC